mmetsp:Transcript_17789/g.32954  ORF Transcript_17789/g.32954 Transcript_17789/m.32954 type:complete len:93 (-) Transcript_17789:700-978(-)
MVGYNMIFGQAQRICSGINLSRHFGQLQMPLEVKLRISILIWYLLMVLESTATRKIWDVTFAIQLVVRANAATVDATVPPSRAIRSRQEYRE